MEMVLFCVLGDFRFVFFDSTTCHGVDVFGLETVKWVGRFTEICKEGELVGRYISFSLWLASPPLLVNGGVVTLYPLPLAFCLSLPVGWDEDEDSRKKGLDSVIVRPLSSRGPVSQKENKDSTIAMQRAETKNEKFEKLGLVGQFENWAYGSGEAGLRESKLGLGASVETRLRGQLENGLVGQYGNWAFRASFRNWACGPIWKLGFEASVETGLGGPVWKLGLGASVETGLRGQAKLGLWGPGKLGLGASFRNWALGVSVEIGLLGGQVKLGFEPGEIGLMGQASWALWASVETGLRVQVKLGLWARRAGLWGQKLGLWANMEIGLVDQYGNWDLEASVETRLLGGQVNLGFGASVETGLRGQCGNWAYGPDEIGLKGPGELGLMGHHTGTSSLMHSSTEMGYVGVKTNTTYQKFCPGLVFGKRGLGFGFMENRMKISKAICKAAQSWDYGLMNSRAKMHDEIHQVVLVFFFGIGFCLEEVVGMKRIG
ncbi:hypothetical protein V8G54_007434 [Vigna mungo]|uniref:Uncharacterized protein n=1 Tax=Vigna mungo TaxID=3915 RepID=A0AAQ3P3S8_VIGMU